MTKHHENTMVYEKNGIFKRLRLFAGYACLAGCILLAGCGQTEPAAADLLEVVSIESKTTDPTTEEGAVSGEPSSENAKESETIDQEEPTVPSLEAFLRNALLPVGETAYIWGGGWNEEDTAAGPEACSIGVSPNWKVFADGITSDYDTKKTRYQIHDGLDCSGYVGWVVYNTFETEDGKEGYVYSSTKTAETYASFGWGDFLPAKSVQDWRPGDIASMNGHVWISLGTCEDGSVLLVHSSPPGVRLCGTAASKGTSEAVKLATEYMKTYYPDWYSRFPDCESKKTYLEGASQMRWNEETFPDCKELQAMSPEELLKLLYSEEH
jgi:cell wall-associated NlpC family hydrolase